MSRSVNAHCSCAVTVTLSSWSSWLTAPRRSSVAAAPPAAPGLPGLCSCPTGRCRGLVVPDGWPAAGAFL